MIGGICVLNDDDLAERIQFIANAAGAVPGPMDSWLALRGTKTLALRMRQHDANGRRIADALAQQLGAERVFYPGLPSHPQHALAKRQMSGFGGMISVETRSKANAATVLGRVKVFSLAESLGGVESLISHPGVDDARVGGARAARGAGRHRGAGAPLVRRRGRGRPAGGPRAGVWWNLTTLRPPPKATVG